MSKQKRSRVVPLVLGLGLSIFLCQLEGVAADPSISKPNSVLPIHGFSEEAKPLAEQCEKDTAAANKLYENLIKSKKPPDKDPVNQLSVIEKRMARNAGRLLLLVESTGGEYSARQKVHRVQFEEAFNAFPNHPKQQELRQQAIAELQRSSKSRQAKAKEIVAKLQQDPLAAEALLDSALDELESKAGILRGEERAPFSEYEQIRASVYDANEIARRQRTNDAITKRGLEITAEFDRFLAKMQSAAASAKSGRVQFGDASLDSVEFVDAMFRESNAMVLKIQKMNGMQSWIQKPKIGYGAGGPPPAIDPKWGDRLRTLRSEISKSVTTLLENDAKDIPANLAVSRLGQYATVLGKHAHRVDGDEWINPFDEAIMSAARKLNISDTIGSYQKATADVLAWRERFAQKQESILAKQGTRLHDVLVKSSTKTMSEPGYFAVVQGTPAPELHDPTLIALPAMAKLMPKDSSVVVGNVVRMDTESAVWLSKWDNFTYARLPESFYKAENGKMVARWLNVDDAHPALSVRAASAIYSAERGDRLTVGGTAKEVYIEGAATRLQTVPDTASPFVGYSQAIQLPKNQTAKTASLRVAVTPRWYRHRYFVVPSIAN